MPALKRKVVLEFPSLKELIDFATVVNLGNCEIIRTRNLLISELSSADIELAQRNYSAVSTEEPL